MNTVIPTPRDAVEDIGKRTMRSKVFEVNGKRKLVQVIATAAHVPDDIPAWEGGGTFNWEDIDTTVKLRRGFYRATRTWTDTKIDPAAVGYNYLSKRGGDVSVEISRVNNVPVQAAGLSLIPRMDGSRLWFDNIIQGLDVYFDFRPAGIRTLRRVRSSTRGQRPLKLQWDITTASATGINPIKTNVNGQDNYDYSSPSRPGKGTINSRRIVEIEQSQSMDRNKITHNEELTGRAVWLNPLDRVPELRNEFVFPVEFHG